MRNIFCMWLYDAPCQVYVCSGTTSRSCLACDKTCSTDACISSIDHGMLKNCDNATTKPGRFNVAVAHFICRPLNEWQPPGHRHLPVNTINVAAARSKPQEMHKGTFLPILYTQWVKQYSQQKSTTVPLNSTYSYSYIFMHFPNLTHIYSSPRENSLKHPPFLSFVTGFWMVAPHRGRRSICIG